jgi:hypothetical protein
MSIVKQAIILELQEKGAKAVEFKKKVDSAKTDVKRALYKKKLKKNNEEAADLFIALNRLVEKEQASGVALGVENEVSVLTGQSEEEGGVQQAVE